MYNGRTPPCQACVVRGATVIRTPTAWPLRGLGEPGARYGARHGARYGEPGARYGAPSGSTPERCRDSSVKGPAVVPANSSHGAR